MYELFWWFWVAYTLKLLKPWGASLASLGVLSNIFTKIAQGCQPGTRWAGTRLILNHDTIPYLKMKRNFIHTLFLGTPFFWGSGYQTIAICCEGFLPYGSTDRPGMLEDNARSTYH